MRSKARCKSPESQSSTRLRSAAFGNKAATAAGSGLRFICPRCLANGDFERLVEVGEDVIDVLDSHAQANAAGSHTRRQLFSRRHLPVGRRSRMAGEGFRIAQIHQALEEFERIVEAHACAEAAADLEGHERAGMRFYNALNL